MTKTEKFQSSLAEHTLVLNLMASLEADLVAAADAVARAFSEGKKVLLCGNGGSAADAQHIACELVGRFFRERRAVPAIALTTDTSILTAVANDYSFDDVFARQVEAFGQPGDVLIAITTSGNSKNVIRAAEAARERGLIVIGLSGRTGGKLKELSDPCLCVPSDSTPRIQEMHILLGHILCEIVEEGL
jgi:D-sedoheptulose 7-phosphate isomerase